MTTAASSPWRNLSPEHATVQKAFYEVRVKHPKLNAVLSELQPLLLPHSESNIICIVGATGTGKSTLSNFALKSLYEGYAQTMADDLSAIPVVRVEAYTTGKTLHPFRGLFADVQQELQDPTPDKKSMLEERDGRVTLHHSKNDINELRRSVENLLKRRRTRVWVIDEAYHLLKFGDHADVMDTLKSIANTTGVKIVLVGSFDLFTLVEGHAQVARRTTIINFDRYHMEIDEDRLAFREVVRRLQGKWPCAEVPNFVAISDSLLDLSLGCVGLLKSFLLDAAAHQLCNNGVWEREFLKRAAKANTLRQAIRKEIDQGEPMVYEALYGRGLFDDQKIIELDRRMKTHA